MKPYHIDHFWRRVGIELRQNEDPVRAEEDPGAGVPAPAVVEAC